MIQAISIMQKGKIPLFIFPAVKRRTSILCFYENLGDNLQAPVTQISYLYITWHILRYFRSNLMVVILNRMIQEVLPASSTRMKAVYSLPLTMPAQTMLSNVFKEAFNKSCMDLHSMHKLDNLLNITGPQWFAQQLVRVR